MTGIKEKVKDLLHVGKKNETDMYEPTTGATGYSTGYTDAGVANTAATNQSAYGEGGVVSGASGGATTDGQVRVSGYQQAPVNTGEKVFTVTEDHAVEKERRERWVEHQPVEREYVTKVEPTGRVQEGAVTAEAGAATEREIRQETGFNTGTTTVQGVQGNPVSTGTGY